MAEAGSAPEAVGKGGTTTAPAKGKGVAETSEGFGSNSRMNIVTNDPSEATVDLDLDDEEDETVYISIDETDEESNEGDETLDGESREEQGDDGNETLDGESGEEQGDEGFVFKIGIHAMGDEDAYNKYNAYAYSRGFGIRRSHKVRGVSDGKVRVRKFVCANEGLKKKTSDGRNLLFKGRREDSRTGCTASAHFKVFDDDDYVLFRFSDDHNHALIPEGSRHQLRSHRGICQSSALLLDGLRKAGVGPTVSYKVATEIAGGYASVGFSRKDCLNHVTVARDIHYSAGDCQSLLDHFNIRQGQDPLFFYSIQCDSENRLTNIFWRDGSAAQNYEHFGDVMVFDTTFKTNRYDMVCAPFFGINNHWSNVFFGCAFLLVETIESFTWLFKTFRQSMGDVAPKTIFTDEDARMAAAIKEVFPESQHRLCIWHIGENAKLHVGRFFGLKGFKKTFLDILHEVDDPEEFEVRWAKMLLDYDLQENAWLQKLYRKKALWAPAYGRDVFRGNMHSSQRSESANSVFKRLTTKTRTLRAFVEQYESHNEYLREEERKHNCRCFRGKPKIILSDVGFLEHAAEVYTHTIFYRFQQEVMDSVAEDIIDSFPDIDGSTIVVRRGATGRKYFVKCNQQASRISCSCKFFETAGYLCRHSAKVMRDRQWSEIPIGYILRRWTRDLKFSQSLSMPPASATLSNKSPDSLSALNRLMRSSFATMNLCSEHVETTKMAAEILEKLDSDCKRYRSENYLVGQDEVNEYDDVVEPVRDPYTRIQKRRNGKRPANTRSKSKRRTTKVTRVDHEGMGEESNRFSGDGSGASPSTSFSPNLPYYFGNLGEVPRPVNMTFTQLLSQTTQNLSQPVTNSSPLSRMGI